jgi:L-fucose isomerase
MHKAKVGILTFSDGRDYIHKGLEALNRRYQERLAAALEKAGVEVVQGEEIVWNNVTANREGRRLAAAACDLTICTYAIWCYPHLTALATAHAPGPFLLFCQIHPSEPGMVGMMAAAGTLAQLGRPHERVWGDIEDPNVLAKVMAYVRAAGAIKALRGQTYGLFGGRPLGMYTAVSNLDQWQVMFGLDVEHVEQEDVVRASARVDAKRVDKALAWLEQHVGKIAFTRLECGPDEFLARFPCNHIHGCYGDWVCELRHVCAVLGIGCEVFSETGKA